MMRRTLVLFALFTLASTNSLLGQGGWKALGLGLTGAYPHPKVRAMVVYKGCLIVGGEFSQAGGISASNIASWNGKTWSPLGSGMNLPVKALCIFEGKLIAGGEFTTAGGVSAHNIAAWNDSSWVPIDSRMDGNVNALAVYDGQLIVAGHSRTVGDGSAETIARWDGTSWSPLGVLTLKLLGPPHVSILTVFDNLLIAGGFFSHADGIPASRIACWDGESWHSMGGLRKGADGLSGPPSAMITHKGQLIAGGHFIGCGLGKAPNIAAASVVDWNRKSWFPLDGANVWSGRCTALANYNGLLIAAGRFSLPGGQPEDMMRCGNGRAWSPLSFGLEGSIGAFSISIEAFAIYNKELIVAGYFETAGGVPANCIAAWRQ